MVRDVRDCTFSSLDCFWSLRKVYILPLPSGQYELMSQSIGLHTNALVEPLEQWLEPLAGTIVTLSLT